MWTGNILWPNLQDEVRRRGSAALPKTLSAKIWISSGRQDSHWRSRCIAAEPGLNGTLSNYTPPPNILSLFTFLFFLSPAPPPWVTWSSGLVTQITNSCSLSVTCTSAWQTPCGSLRGLFLLLRSCRWQTFSTQLLCKTAAFVSASVSVSFAPALWNKNKILSWQQYHLLSHNCGWQTCQGQSPGITKPLKPISSDNHRANKLECSAELCVV